MVELPFGSRVNHFTYTSLGLNDSVAQLVEQYTFNVWVLGSNPSGITSKSLKTPISYDFGVFLCPIGHSFVVFCIELFGSTLCSYRMYIEFQPLFKDDFLVNTS